MVIMLLGSGAGAAMVASDDTGDRNGRKSAVTDTETARSGGVAVSSGGSVSAASGPRLPSLRDLASLVSLGLGAELVVVRGSVGGDSELDLMGAEVILWDGQNEHLAERTDRSFVAHVAPGYYAAYVRGEHVATPVADRYDQGDVRELLPQNGYFEDVEIVVPAVALRTISGTLTWLDGSPVERGRIFPDVTYVDASEVITDAAGHYAGKIISGGVNRTDELSSVLVVSAGNSELHPDVAYCDEYECGYEDVAGGEFEDECEACAGIESCECPTEASPWPDAETNEDTDQETDDEEYLGC